MNLLPDHETAGGIKGRDMSSKRVISPYRNIVVNSFADDFYSNLLDWSREIIYYCIENRIYSYNFFTEEISELFACPSVVTAIKHNRRNEVLLVGCTTGMIFYIDTVNGEIVKKSDFSNRQVIHKSRIGVIKNYGDCIITGSRDRKAKMIDLRSRNVVNSYASHSQEICGISVGNKMVATGGNDNKVFVYDYRSSTPVVQLNEHKAAVKALSWSPYSNMLVTGGGSADKTMKLYDVGRKECLVKSINFDSQLTNIKWLTKGTANNLVLSTFGYSDDDTKLLRDFKVQKQYSGHKNRVIHFSVSEDERYFSTGSGDGTIKIWEIGGDLTEEIRMR
ncbi:hypothetical protein NUSPORA_02426 [Nucleospora cyclopteri]